MTTLNNLHRVSAFSLEVNVAYGCNLKCEYCTHLGRFMKGIVPLDELLLWYRSWNTKVHPRTVRILGGEPLLHPHLESILYETGNHWQDSRLELVTNGLLLHKMEPSVFSILKEVEAHVVVSKHFDDPHYNSLLHAGIEILCKYEIEPRVVKSNRLWVKCYHFDEQGCAIPYQSSPKKAWRICHVKNRCTTLLDNCLYRCPQLGCFSKAVEQGVVSEDWKVVLDYKPLPPSCTREELETFMHGGTCEQCSICPEKFQHANMYEKLNPFGLPLIQNHFCGNFNEEET